MRRKKALRAKNIRFQTPFPAKLRVFYEGETRVYNTVRETSEDMVARGFQVEIVKPVEDWAGWIKKLSWTTSHATLQERP